MQLHNHPKCTQFLHDLLDMVERDMLIVKNTDHEAKDRIEAHELYAKFNTIVGHCRTDLIYATAPVLRVPTEICVAL